VDFLKAEIIENDAFNGCVNLKEANFSQSADNPTTANLNMLFTGCTKLEKLQFYRLEGGIGDSTFKGKTSLQYVRFDLITSIGNNAFNGCTALNSLYLPAVTSIGGGAFNGCASLQVASFDNATEIWNNAFDGCTSLFTASFKSATHIHDEVFARTGGTPLSITLGAPPSGLGKDIFKGVTVTKNVFVRVPSANYESYNNSAWKDAFRGYGSGSPHGTVNIHINLGIEATGQ
jgi:hypothetical protein